MIGKGKGKDKGKGKGKGKSHRLSTLRWKQRVDHTTLWTTQVVPRSVGRLWRCVGCCRELAIVLILLTLSEHGRQFWQFLNSFQNGTRMTPHVWPRLCPMLPPTVQILIDNIFLTWRVMFPICVIYLYMLVFTFIYFQIRPNTFQYRYMPSHTSIHFKIYLFKESEAQHTTQQWS